MPTRNKTRQHPVQGSSSAGHHVRAELGLTQEELARLLGVSRVALAKDEGGTRYLPSAAQRVLLDLVRCLLDHPAEDAPPPLPPDAAQREQLEILLLGNKVAEYPVRQRLARLQTQLAQLRRRQQLAPALRELLPGEPPWPRQFLDVQVRQAGSRLALDATEPLLLELRLRVLAFERAEIERLLGGAAGVNAK